MSGADVINESIVMGVPEFDAPILAISDGVSEHPTVKNPTQIDADRTISDTVVGEADVFTFSITDTFAETRIDSVA